MSAKHKAHQTKVFLGGKLINYTKLTLTAKQGSKQFSVDIEAEGFSLDKGESLLTDEVYMGPEGDLNLLLAKFDANAAAKQAAAEEAERKRVEAAQEEDRKKVAADLKAQEEAKAEADAKTAADAKAAEEAAQADAKAAADAQALLDKASAELTPDTNADGTKTETSPAPEAPKKKGK